MISSEVQRTLVKSPPELWAEISDPDSLARHLGEFGEIRITRVEPEQRVEWQSGDTSGSVVIKPSGWGTKVMLTVTRTLAEQPAGAADAEVDAAPQIASQADVEHAPAPDVEPQATAAALPEPEPEPEPAAELEDRTELEIEFESEAEPDSEPPEPTVQDQLTAREGEDELEPAEAIEQQPRRGFFARLFGRRRRAPAAEPTHSERASHERIEGDAEDAEDARAVASQPYNALAVWASQIDSDADSEAEADVEVDANTAAVEQIDDEQAHEYAAQAFTQPEPAPGEPSHVEAPDDGDAAEGISAEIRAAEEVAAEEVTAVLTGVLDRLGAAHHRPFSRA